MPPRLGSELAIKTPRAFQRNARARGFQVTASNLRSKFAGILFCILVTASAQGMAESSAISETLPMNVQVDLLMKELSNLLKAGNHNGVVELITRIRTLDIEIPDAFYFLEAEALFNTGQALIARDRLLVYLTNTGRDGKFYRQASELLLKVRAEAEIQEQRRRAEERVRAEQLALAAEKTKALEVRETQRYLHQLGFPLGPDTGELTKATREAIAVFQVRRDLEVNGEVTDELLAQLRGEVPESHNCDALASYEDAISSGIPIMEIAHSAAIPACNDALRKSPDVIRFQVQYARALLAANRNDDALNAVEDAARKEYPEAETLVGWMHQQGRLSGNAKPDYTNAIRWYRFAAKRNYAEAQRRMGYLYAKGMGVVRNDAAAAKWYQKGAIQGYAPAQVDLGNLFEVGRGVKRNYATAMDWYTRAADKDFAPAQFYLGRMFERGRGVKRNKSIALNWYRKAGNQGHVEAMNRTKRLGG